MLEGLKLRAPVKKPKVLEEEPTKKFNFGTVKRKLGDVRTIPWLEDKTVDELADLWKIGHVQKKMSPEDLKKFDEIKYYLKAKFGVEGVK